MERRSAAPSVAGTAGWDVVLIWVRILDAVRPCGKDRCQGRAVRCRPASWVLHPTSTPGAGRAGGTWMDDSVPPHGLPDHNQNVLKSVSPGSLVCHVGSPRSVCGCPPGWPCCVGAAAGLRGLGLDLPGYRQGPAWWRAAADDGLRQPVHHCRRRDVPGVAPVLEDAETDPAAVA
ncbi:hypothetical protein D3C72_1166000 [compost metagenome]